MTKQKFKNFQAYYAYYNSIHRNTGNRILHFVGTAMAALALITAILFHQFSFLILVPVGVYGFGWLGHLLLEKDKSPLLAYPLYDFAANFISFWAILTGTESFKKI